MFFWRQGVEVGKFDTLAEAVRRASGGDTIEIRGNGPFLIDPIEDGLKNLTIRAGSGYVPVIKPNPATVKGDNAALLQVHGPVTLEGLELHHEGSPQKAVERGIVAAYSAPLYLTNCKLVVNPGKPIRRWAIYGMWSARGQVRNCLIVSPGDGITLGNAPGMDWTVENCLIAAGHENWKATVELSPDTENSPGTKLRLTRNTLVSYVALCVAGPADPLGKRLRDKAAKAVVPAVVEAHENICQFQRVFTLNSGGGTLKPPLTVEEQQQFLPKFIQWREQANVYGLGDKFFLNLHTRIGLLNGLAEWNKFWGIKDTGSVQGAVRRLLPAFVGRAGADQVYVGAEVLLGW